MKELSIEEKAKAYNIALDKIKRLLGTGSSCSREELEYVFPELKESEDDRIRGAIIDHLKDNNLTEWAAWLEKQGKNNMGISETTKKELEDNLNKALEKETPESWNEFLEKQGEQKPADKTDSVINILNNENREVQQKDLIKKPSLITIENEPKNYKKQIWSKKNIRLLNNCISLIEDIDCTKEEQNFLKSLKNRVQPKQEWKQENTGDLTEFENTMMHIGNSFFGDNAGLDPNDTNTIKKQANLLLELVPKQEWSEEDENNILFLTSIIEEYFKDKKKITLYGDTVCANFTKEDVIDRLKSLSPKSHWKPSDEQMDMLAKMCSTLHLTYGENEIMESIYDALKKLKEIKL